MHLDLLHLIGPRPHPTRRTLDPNHEGNSEEQTNPAPIQSAKTPLRHTQTMHANRSTPIERAGNSYTTAHTHQI